LLALLLHFVKVGLFRDKLLIIPIAQMTLSIMVMKKGISGAEAFSKVITGAGAG